MAFQGISPVRFESVSAVTATNSVDLGTRAVDEGNEYVYVYNAGASQISKGHAAILSGVSGYSVTVSSTTMADIPVGMAKHGTIAAGSYGWLLTKGFASFIAGANDSFTTGNLLGVGVDGAFSQVSGITGYLSPAVGKALVGTDSGVSAGFAYFKF